MLKVSIHASALAERSPANKLAVLDIAYRKQDVLADYMLALSTRGAGESEPAFLTEYPRWSGSLWDITARALALLLYKTETPPGAGAPDHRCAFATHICAAIEGMTATDSGVELGTAQIAQMGRRRGHYSASFEEDILGARTATFEFGRKALNPAELVMRGACWALYGQDVPGRRPRLILPPSLKIDGVERFHIEALEEPARTGFKRYLAGKRGAREEPAGMPRAEDYVRFLMRG